jgi:ribosomal protein S19E (S16A)
VAVTDALVAMGHIVLTDEGGEVTSSGERFLSAFGADLRPRTRRIFCQPCLDWSERRYHLKGLVGARILDRLLELGWLKCVSGSRALQLTSSGRVGLSEVFRIEINEDVARPQIAPNRFRQYPGENQSRGKPSMSALPESGHRPAALLVAFKGHWDR